MIALDRVYTDILQWIYYEYMSKHKIPEKHRVCIVVFLKVSFCLSILQTLQLSPAVSNSC